MGSPRALSRLAKGPAMETSASAGRATNGRLTPLWVFLGGIALTGAFYAVVTGPSLGGSLVYRYFCGHPIEEWTTWLFFWGMTALGAKTFRLVAESRVLRYPVLPLD